MTAPDTTAPALSPIYESTLGVRRCLLVSISSWTVLTLVSRTGGAMATASARPPSPAPS